jgi:hypothetical protein
MSKNRGKSKLSKNVLFNANKHVSHCEKSLGTLFYGQPSYFKHQISSSIVIPVATKPIFPILRCCIYIVTLFYSSKCFTRGAVGCGTGMTQFMPQLVSWEFWHKLNQKYNGDVYKNIMFCYKISSNKCKIHVKFYFMNLLIENCIMFNVPLKALHHDSHF